MAKRNRGTLKRFFEKGALPSADHFADLMDSTLNIRDDGFDKTPKDGLKLASINKQDALMSFYYQSFDLSEASWLLKYNEERATTLDFVSRPVSDPKTVLSLDEKARVGVRTSSPKSALDVNGTITCKAIQGVEEKPVLANGKWYDITEELSGINSFQLTAAVGIPGTRMFAMLSCTANGINEKTPKWYHLPIGWSKRFKKQHVYYSSFSDRIQIRWCKKSEESGYFLQLRTACDYNYCAQKANKPVNDGIRIRYHLRSLWSDSDTNGCNEPLSPLEKEEIELQDAARDAQNTKKAS